MSKFKLNEEKQEILKMFLGEEFYNNLYWYQKWILQGHIKDKDIKRYTKIKEFLQNEKNGINSDTKYT